MLQEHAPLLGRSGEASNVSKISTNKWRTVAARMFFISSSCLLLAVATIMTGSRRVSLEKFSGDDSDAKFLRAEASNEDGHKFIQKLQETWFVTKYRFDEKFG